MPQTEADKVDGFPDWTQLLMSEQATTEHCDRLILTSFPLLKGENYSLSDLNLLGYYFKVFLLWNV